MKLNNYIEHIVSKGLNLQKNQVVEIATSSYINNFNEELKHTCLKHGASMVFFRYRDGRELEDKINDGYSKYINDEISKYNKYIKDNSLVRIVVDSPFTPPMSLDDEKKKEYKNEQKKLKFVNDYFNELYSQRIMVTAANPYWAAHLCMSVVDLWDIIFDMCKLSSNRAIMSKINKICPNRIHFIGKETDLWVGLTANNVFQGDTQITSNNISYNPNYPCLEMFTAPSKYDVNGYITVSRAFNYNGIILDGKIEFKDGRLVNNDLANKLSEIDDGLLYTGEISLCENKRYPLMGSLLLDENMGCHIALGYAYKYGIEELDKINTASHHVDIVFGSDDLDVYILKNNEEYKIMDRGRFIDDNI